MTPPRRRTAALVFTAALALYTLTAGGSLTSTDAVVTFELTRSLVDRQSIALSGNILGLEANRGVDGRIYSQYGIGQSIYNIPFYVAAIGVQAIVRRQIGKPDTLLKAAVAMGSAVAAALTVLLVWRLSLALGGSGRAALFAAATAAIGSPLWPYSKFGFSTALTAALLAATAALLVDAARTGSTKRAAAAGAILAFGWLTRHEMAVALVPFSAFLWLRVRERAVAVRLIVAFGVVAGCGGLLWAWYNFVRFGNPLTVGYAPRFDGSGYLAFLVSPAGSVVLFAPMLIAWLAAFAGRDRWRGAEAILLLGPLLIFYLFYGALADWPGGRSYGPRYLVPALVLLAPSAGRLWDARRTWRPALAAALAACAILQLPGVLVDYSKVSVDWARGASRQAIDERNWHLESSPFVLGARAAATAVPANAAYLAGLRTPPAIAARAAGDDRDFAQQFSFSLDFWWLYLVYLQAIPRALALAVAVALAAAAAAAALLAWRLTPHTAAL